MTEILAHYSSTPLGTVRSVEQGPMSMKPRGLWVSVDSCEDNWKTWCETEQWALDELKHRHIITLAEDARILRVSGEKGIDSFTAEYGHPDTVEGTPVPGLSSTYDISWRRVAFRFQGIIIAPYVWSRRLHRETRWYYGWDCASGCIWDAKAIASVERVS